MKIAFQGTKGAYSELALYKFFGEMHAKPIGFDLSEEVFQAVEESEVDYGIIPVENSIVGNVAINTDLILTHELFIIGEVYLDIHHCLLALPGVKLEDIKTVHSHPVAQAQCHDFLARHKITPIPDFDTAGACENLVRKKLKHEATIASALCAKYYKLNIVEESIQKVKHNITRFMIMVKKENIPENHVEEKTSIAFNTKHHPGALLNCLQEFANHKINLTKLESRPIPENPFKYTFLVDFEGSTHEENVRQCLEELKEDCDHIKILGSYPHGKRD